MFSFKIELAPFERLTEQLNAAQDQMPFALSRALNDAANDAYNFLIDETWPKSVTVRNSHFLRWALKTDFSTKSDLSIRIFDQRLRANLELHAEGGTKEGKGMLAIPTHNVDRGAHGVRASELPRNLKNAVIKGNKIYQAVGKGKNRKLVLMYTLAKSARQPMDVPFETDFAKSITDSALKHFPQRMMEAMRTRR